MIVGLRAPITSCLSKSSKPRHFLFITHPAACNGQECSYKHIYFFYSLTICLLHYYPRHVSSINMPIFRRKNCIHTASGIFVLCKRLHSTLVESGLQSALNQCTVQTFTESEDTRCCVNTIFPPENGHVNARNMSRIIV